MKEGPDSEQLPVRSGEMREPAFSGSACQVGFNDEKDELMLSPESKRACSGTVVSVDRPPVLPQNPSDTICIVWILPRFVARKRFSAISTPFLYYPEERGAKLDPLVSCGVGSPD